MGCRDAVRSSGVPKTTQLPSIRSRRDLQDAGGLGESTPVPIPRQAEPAGRPSPLGQEALACPCCRATPLSLGLLSPFGTDLAPTEAWTQFAASRPLISQPVKGSVAHLLMSETAQPPSPATRGQAARQELPGASPPCWLLRKRACRERPCHGRTRWVRRIDGSRTGSAGQIVSQRRSTIEDHARQGWEGALAGQPDDKQYAQRLSGSFLFL